MTGVWDAAVDEATADPMFLLFAALTSAGLMVVMRWRKLGWCIGLAAQTLLITMIAVPRGRWLTAAVAAVAVATYARSLYVRRRESWLAIPTPRERDQAVTACADCCTHGRATAVSMRSLNH